MNKIIILAAAMALLPMAAVAQSTPNANTTKSGEASPPNTGVSGNKNSTSSQNTPTTGEPAGRNNPSVDRAPDTAPSRGTPHQQ
jgi:hypothetical protein